MKRGLLGRWLHRRRAADGAEVGGGEDILQVARAVETRIDQLVNRIFADYGVRLLEQPITCIIPAVWGATKDAEMTPLQKRIYQDIGSAIQEAQDQMELRDLRPEQEFAIGYILRSLVISKIVYMVEATWRRQAEQVGETVNLDDLEPMGRA